MQMESIDHSNYYVNNHGTSSMHNKPRHLNSIDTQFMEHIAGEMIAESNDSFVSYHTEQELNSTTDRRD